MPIDCAQLMNETLDRLRLDFSCETEERGVSVVTPYLHPDSSLVEVFVQEQGALLRVSDLGETLRRLRLQGADPLASPKGKFIAEQTAARLQVKIDRGCIEKVVGPSGAAEALLDVVAAAQALGGLIYTSRSMTPASFPQEVGAFLREREVSYSTREEVPGQSGRVYKVGFCFLNPETQAPVLLEPLSPPQKSAMTPLINRTVRMWVDVSSGERKVSLLNDVDFEWSAEDSAVLGRLSEIALWSQKERLLEAA